MRLTFIEAESFLSLRAFRLDLDERNVLVGPNGAGKSNIFRCVDLIAKAVAVAAESSPATYPALDDYATAGNRRAPGPPFTVRVGVELTEPGERRLIHLFLRAAVLTNLFAGRNEPVVPTIADSFVERAIPPSKARPLYQGALVVRHDPGQWPWSVGFEFEHGGQSYTYGMLGAANSGVVSGALLPPTQQSLSGPRLVDRLLPGDEKADRPPGGGELTTFELAMLLPRPGEYINVAVQPVPQHGGTPILNDFEQNFPAPQHNRSFTLAAVLDRIVSTSLVMVADRRGLPKLHYSSDDLSRRPVLADGSEIPAALWTLQGGTPAAQRELGRIRSLFTRLTGDRFELQHAPIVSPLHDTSTGRPPTPQDAVLRIEPMVVEGPTDIPVQFAGAGIWEALVLATAAVDRRGKVLLLDEPASHLHPTLQARLWRELASARMQSILITHSAYLVPHSAQDDLESVVRVVRRGGQTEARRLNGDGGHAQAAPLPRSRWLQIMRSADMRAALFANAVVLVEGPSDFAALSIWWPKSQTALRVGSPDDLNLVLLEVEGEAGFDTTTKYLDSFAIPWAIVCDGKAIAPTRANALIRRLASTDTADAPPATATFDRWRTWWEARGVYTLARASDDEIERFFEQHDPKTWEAAKRQERGRSKPRKAVAFAEATACPAAADWIYAQIISRVRT